MQAQQVEVFRSGNMITMLSDSRHTKIIRARHRVCIPNGRLCSGIQKNAVGTVRVLDDPKRTDPTRGPISVVLDCRPNEINHFEFYEVEPVSAIEDAVMRKPELVGV